MYTAVFIVTLFAGQTPSFTRAAERGLASVVTVDALRVVAHEPPPDWIIDLLHGPPRSSPPRERVHGSAVIISADGLLITSEHLVAGAEEVRIETPDGRELPARVLGGDPATDIAVLRVDTAGRPLRPIDAGDSSSLRAGDFVLAVGDPFLLGLSVTLGVVSKSKVDVGVAELEELIQTDAAINPGNSGGALVDIEGRLVGINTAILTRSGANQGVGFAVPVEVAMQVALALAREGRVVRGWLGVELQDVDARLRAAFCMRAAGGALITELLKSGPAESAGLLREDVVIAADGVSIPNASALRNFIARKTPGTRVVLDVRRCELAKQISVVLAVAPAAEPAPELGPRPPDTSLGVRLSSAETLQRLFKLPEWISQGVVVIDLAAGSVADLAGIEVGDVIVELDRRAISEPEAVENTWRAATRPILVRVVRDARPLYLMLPPGAASVQLGRPASASSLSSKNLSSSS